MLKFTLFFLTFPVEGRRTQASLGFQAETLTESDVFDKASVLPQLLLLALNSAEHVGGVRPPRSHIASVPALTHPLVNGRAKCETSPKPTARGKNKECAGKVGRPVRSQGLRIEEGVAFQTKSLFANKELLSREEEVALSRQVQRLLKWEATRKELERKVPWDAWATACSLDTEYFKACVQNMKQTVVKLEEWENKVPRLQAPGSENANFANATKRPSEETLEIARTIRNEYMEWKCKLADLEGQAFEAIPLGREATVAEWAEACRMDEAEFKVAVSRARRAKDRLVSANMPLVASIAKKYSRVLPFDDLIQEGTIGLIKAIEKFDCARGLKLSTVATWWIRASLQDACLKIKNPIRLPKYLMQRYYKYKSVEAELQRSLGRRPTNEEICGQMNLSLKQLSRLQEAMPTQSGQFSIDAYKENFGREPSSKSMEPMDAVERSMEKEAEEKMLSSLPEFASNVMRLRYIMDMKPQEIKNVLGIDKRTLQNTMSRSIRQLRRRYDVV